MVMGLGLQRGTVRLTRDHAAWAEAFKQEKSLLLAHAGSSIIDLQHVGSTAIQGIDAKPILDMLLGLATLTDEPLIRPILESLSYIYRGEQGISGRILYVKGEPDRTHHLHIAAHLSPFWNDHIAFRDALNASPEKAQAYNQLKHSLAAQYPNDREAYTSGKHDFIRTILDQA